ncbi:hypothetical protein [Pseudomonas orientalis]|uniref:3-Oxoacyl-[acyl-carrier-protein (ACP)] synthase III n=1 Tax=Pseudomonas orientalis TaxID=76758 RepID=A0A1H2EWC3_9PSED|nr:hypothetical protein [Pseudomonas orientalis]KRP67562.1 hypothetical protein TU82_02015 [Pseudomonas orientalis]SDT99440.1 3-Oxoacyl-[acyl-carrier-protein (ACP)] synthase III [Pseudomonas orientalis]
MTIFINDIDSTLGEHRFPYNKVEDFDQKRRHYGLPDAPHLMGWHSLHRTSGNVLDLAERVIEKIVGRSSAAQSTDHLVLCSSRFSVDFMQGNDRLDEMMTRCAISNVPVTGLTLSGCNSLFNGLHLASAMIESSRADRVLLVTADASAGESKRFDSNCMFSDAASAAILSNKGPSSLTLLDVVCGFGRSTNDSSFFRGNLPEIGKKLKDMLAKHGLQVSDLTKVVTPNFYLPVVNMLMNSLALPAHLHFSGQATLSAHCFSSDYLMALAEIAQTETHLDEYYLLLGYADLHQGIGLVRKPAKRK